MDNHNALESLQTIRTLMERSALYRRALSPIMMFVGGFGIVASGVAIFTNIHSPRMFIAFWLCVAVIAIAGAFILVRRQALRSAEPFWSPPTRRVAQALLPALLVGFLFGILAFFFCGLGGAVETTPANDSDVVLSCGLAALWAICYGLALHSGGFFVSRGLRLFGWIYVVFGNIALFALYWLNTGNWESDWRVGHLLMGGLFGIGQFAYGLYLYLTGEERNEL